MEKNIKDMSLEYSNTFKDNKETHQHDYEEGAKAVCEEIKSLITPSNNLYDVTYAYDTITKKVKELTEENVKDCNT